jgi:eukaryotic-like serine/threonine-protein kinase
MSSQHETASDATWSPDAPSAVPPEEPAFPVTGWDRYVPLRFLGQGGMGKVFLARDVRLQREVAIKFVHGDGRGSIARLVAEARAQARVIHERVCKVYEVGEVQGEVYIAMQFIDGETLGAMADRLGVEQKARMVREAALGVHEAHRQGIIHRDLKPSNVMVARGEDGDLLPYVMDFGMARFLRAGGSTETGTVLGTPHFMSPEQARGEVSRLDRRTDVYALGATLYALLTGVPPVPGAHALQVLDRIGRVEPRPPRTIDPDIPADLEAITLKCLENDRSARYDSARALADDLDRFLGGEPVLARPAGLGYRLRKRLWKHRRAVAASSIAILAVLVAVGFGLSARAQAATRERLARRFTERVEHIEAAARYSALSRLHDIRGDRAQLRATMGELEDEIRRAGPPAVGPGSYALGRGYLALGEDAKAREALESAWSHGFREPRAAYALALAMGHLYQEGLHEVERISDKDRREEQRRKIEQRYRDPALEYLKQSAGADVPSAAYVAALVAFYEGHHEDALLRLDAIGGGLPWFYEAPALRGDVLEARAARRWDEGNREGAHADFEAGRRAYVTAAAIGESAPAVHEAMGELEYAAMQMEIYGQGEAEAPFARGVAATARALAATPDRYASLVLMARLYRSLAAYRTDRGGAVDDLLPKAVVDAERAVAIDPSLPAARLELGRIYRQWGDERQKKNQDPQEQLRRAVEAYEGIAPADRDYDYYSNLGVVFKVWADHEDGIGADAEANRGKAIDAYTKAMAIDDRAVAAIISLGTNYYTRGMQPRATDPDGDLGRAIAAMDKALARNPKHVVPYFVEGEAYRTAGRRKRTHGGDPRPDFAKAMERYEQGLAINPKLPHLHNGVGMLLHEQAWQAWDEGRDPDPLLDQARAASERAIAAAPDQGHSYSVLGWSFRLRADFDRARGRDPTAAAAAAVTAFGEALRRIPGNPRFLGHLGRAQSILADWALEQGRDPGPLLDEASATIRHALERNPNEHVALLSLGHVRATLARARAGRRQGKAEDFEAAAEAFRKAIAAAPGEPEARVDLGHFCRAWASWAAEAGGDARGPLREGLALAEGLLATRPGWPDARALRASLLLLEAEGSARPEERRALAASAAADFGAALAENPNLEKAWGGAAGRARELAAPR